MVRDLFLNRLVSLLSSLTSEATILVLLSLVASFNVNGRNPRSLNDVSVPSTLVPLTVLTLTVALSDPPGVVISYTGVIVSY